MKRVILACTLFAISSPFSLAADLAQIDRRIAKEPAYRGQPKYAMLVFGADANTRIWLVQDGDTLYVDKNGNGDLTEPDKKFASKKTPEQEEGAYSFEIGDLRVGDRLHKQLNVYVAKMDHRASIDEGVKAFLAKNPNGRQYGVSADIEMPGFKGTGIGGRVRQRVPYADVNGINQFADKPQDAPVMHFNGPRQIRLWGQHTLTINRETDLVLGVGTPGVGPGTTVWTDYEGVIPDKLYPKVQITFPPKSPGQPPVQATYELEHRC